jgi:hypothetical protein
VVIEADSPALEPQVYLQALDECGAPWAGIPPRLARIETGLGDEEIWLVAVFTLAGDGPSPIMAKIKVSGWQAHHDYILTPQSPKTRCEGKGTSIIVRIPTGILA